jgi:hypothetical protein
MHVRCVHVCVCVVEWSWNARVASHCDKVGAAALVLVLILVVTDCVGGARFVGGVVGAAGAVEVH